ncbi:MAG TPA: DnaJ domain-containing protein [Polyangiaceae bacterium]
MSDAPDRETDLTQEQCGRIDSVFAELSTIDAYRLLGVAPGSDDKAIRRAYGERVREFHPDRFFRKRMGPYRARLEAIFKSVESAYGQLKSKEGRAAYDAAHGIVAVDPQRAKALEMLKQQLQGRHAQARQLAAVAANAMALGDAAAALDSYRKALALAPGDGAIRTAHDAAKREVDQRAAATNARQAEREEQAGHWAEAVRTWERVVQARPDDPIARQRLEAARLRAATDPAARRS